LRSKRCTWGWPVGLGVTVAALLWFVDPAGAIPLESWDDKIPNANHRFKVLTEFGGAAVLDKETQLVWEQSPQPTIHDWNAARLQCTSRTTGGRKGWRLPSVHELASLVDPNASNPALPLGHPFTNVQSEIFWSATPEPFSSPFSWIVVFDFGGVGFNHMSSLLHVWCVRGGQNHGAY
jgi:Protein of unknown function (DUF1566)